MRIADKQRIDAKVRRFVEVYSRMKLNGFIDYDKLVRTWNTKEKIPEAKCKRLLRTRFISDLITEKLIELTEKHGITAKESLEKRKMLLDLAIKKGDLTNANKALDSFDTKLDLQPIKQQQITTTQTDYIKYIDKTKGRIEARQTKEIINTPEVKETREE